MIKILHDKKTYDISNSVYDISLESSWRNGASKLIFKCLNENILFENGDYATFTYNGAEAFAGVVFSISRNDKQEMTVTCYDQLRYLKAKDTVIRNNMTLSEFVNVCCGNMRLATGDICDTKLKLGKYLFENQTYLDMLYASIDDNLLGNDYYYHIYDNFGRIELKELYDMRLPLMLGDDSFVTEYTYEKQIDTDTFNQIKLAKDNEKTAKRDIFIVNDTSSIEKYGLLQYFEKISSEMNEAQIKERAKQLIKLKNREVETLQLKCIGDIRIIGGSGIKVTLQSEKIDTWGIVESVTHKFSKLHTMDIKLVFEEVRT